MLRLPCNRWVDVCSGDRQGRRRNVSRKLPEVSIAAMWASHINSKTRAGQKTSFESCCLIFLNCWQYKNLAFQMLRGLNLTKTVGCLWQDEVLFYTLLVFMCVLCVHTRRPEVNFWWLLLLSISGDSLSLAGRWAPGNVLHSLVLGRYLGCHMGVRVWTPVLMLA